MFLVLFGRGDFGWVPEPCNEIPQRFLLAHFVDAAKGTVLRAMCRIGVVEWVEHNSPDVIR